MPKMCASVCVKRVSLTLVNLAVDRGVLDTAVNLGRVRFGVGTTQGEIGTLEKEVNKRLEIDFLFTSELISLNSQVVAIWYTE